MLRDWWRSLERAPEPLTRKEWGAVAGASLIAALSRVFALARTPWDWDELLFMRGLDAFNVASHHPHPPGFPLFIAAGRIVRALGVGDFRALQALNLIAAIAIVPAMFFLCRELRMRTWPSLSAALLLAFFPNVWIYGGGAFSDVPSMTLIVLALALLLGGCRNARFYLAGAFVLAIAAGVRPQNLLVGFVPFVMASYFRRRADIAKAIVIIAVVVAGSYGAAAWVTGWSAYREALHLHSEYIARVDSFLSPTRPPLWRVFVDFFVTPYRAPLINALVAIAALIGLLRRRPPTLVALAAFAPLCVFSWLMLDHFSASRFSIGYAPLIAILAAEGINAFCVVVVIASFVWTWPAVEQIRTGVSPPVAAIASIRKSVPHGSAIYVDEGMVPFAEWYLPDYDVEPIGDAHPPANWSSRQQGYWLRENATAPPRRRLWAVVRHRYFDVSATPVADGIAFGPGWYPEEGRDRIAWRWMGAHSVAMLPPIAGPARLSLQLYAPFDALGGSPLVTVRVNGAVVDRFPVGRSDVTREVEVRAHAARPNELTIDTDRTVNPAEKHLSADPRVLGLRLNSLRWMAAR